MTKKFACKKVFENFSKETLDSFEDIEFFPYLCSKNTLSVLCEKLQDGDTLFVCEKKFWGNLLFEFFKDKNLNIVEIPHDFSDDEKIATLFFPSYTKPPKGVSRKRAVLVVGGGVGGVYASLTLANLGIKVYLCEISPSIGGVMSQLDKTFPTLDCSICILGPKLVDVGKDERIELLTEAEIIGASELEDGFRVKLRLLPRYVDMQKCTGCGECADVCPIILPNEWDKELKPRKCIHIPFAQSIPLRSTIDMESCIRCGLCVNVCEKEAINLDDTEKELEIDVGAVILSLGFSLFDPKKKGNLGYGTVAGVITNLEFERVICASGPTEGKLLTKEGKPVKRVGFVQCVGSRDINFNKYCSTYCCMASIKEALLVKEYVPDSEVYIFYNDLRTAGKGFEEMRNRAEDAGIIFLRGLCAKIEEEDGGPTVIFEDMEHGEKRRIKLDMVVLACAMEPNKDIEKIARIFGIERDIHGFFKESEPIILSSSSTKEGIFIVGTCVGPKDIPETVADGIGAASLCFRYIMGKEHGKS